MSRNSQTSNDWASRGSKVADLHLDLAIRDADSLEAAIRNLEALELTVATDSDELPDFRSFRDAYDERVHAFVGLDGRYLEEVEDVEEYAEQGARLEAEELASLTMASMFENEWPDCRICTNCGSGFDAEWRYGTSLTICPSCKDDWTETGLGEPIHMDHVRAAQEASRVPALTALTYDKIGFTPAGAAKAHAAGSTPEDAFDYICRAWTPKWWGYDYEFLPWVFSGLPFERGRLYVEESSVDDAFAWEKLAATYELHDNDITLFLRAKFTPDIVSAELGAGQQDVRALVNEAKRVLAKESQHA